VTKEGQRKLFIAGIDGATFTIIEPLLKKGELPTFKKIMAQGVHGTLTSTQPPQSSVAWPSFMTGVNPGKHGVFAFWDRPHGTFYRPLISSKSIRARTIWEILNGHGLRSIVLNHPITYPPYRIDGCMIGGLLTPSEESIFTYPPSLHTELIAEIGDYRIDYELLELIKDRSPVAILKHLYYMLEKRKEAALYLMKHHPWDVFCVVFTITDRIQHFFWKWIDSTGQPSTDPLREKYSRVIFQCYKRIDGILEELLHRLPKETTVCLMSDHGFGSKVKNVHLNQWLRESGFLDIKKDNVRSKGRMTVGRTSLERAFTRLGLEKAARLLPGRCRRFPLPAPRSIPRPLHETIRWHNTKAYANWIGAEEGIFINMKGREPYGIIERGEEYKKIVNEIIDRLKQLTDPDTGERITDWAAPREDVYSGPYIQNAPDIAFCFKEHSYMPVGGVAADSVFSLPGKMGTQEGETGQHRDDGILFLAGDLLKQNHRIEDAAIVDLLPTFLALLGLPLPNNLDGKVLQRAFEKKLDYSLESDSETAIEGKRDGDRGDVYSEEDREALKKRLRGLGYIS
jgi:predicted AlkP superfamily phosphohydrolase/phosphomutase